HARLRRAAPRDRQRLPGGAARCRRAGRRPHAHAAPGARRARLPGRRRPRPRRASGRPARRRRALLAGARPGAGRQEGGAVSARADVAVFMPSLRGGGAERVMLDLAQGMAGRGYAVDVVVVNREGAVQEVGQGVRLVDLERSRAATALPALVRYLRRRRPPVMLSTLEHTNVLAVVAARLVGGTRVVVREANTPDVDLSAAGLKGRAVRLAMRVAYQAATAVVAVSQGVGRSLQATLGLAPERVTVIANPVITERVAEGAAGVPDH